VAKLPSSFSLAALPIKSALSEGRTEDAKTLVVALLRAGKADAVVQRLAADLLHPAKKPRGRQKAQTRHWWEIGDHFRELRDEGVKYEEAIARTVAKFGYSETHVRKAIGEFDEAKSASIES
jgi:hypothetical protein